MATTTFEGGRRIIATRLSPLSIINDSTLTVDPELVVLVDAGRTYKITVMLHVSTNTTADFKSTISGPTGTSGRVVLTKIQTDIEGLGQFTGNLPFNNTDANAAAVTAYTWHGVIKIGAKPGTIGVQWAQNTSNGNPTVVERGSYIEIEALD